MTNIYRTVFILAVILAPGYALANVSAQEDVVQVDIAKNSKDADNGKFYVPTGIRVEVGTTVEWINLDDARHTVTDGTPTGKAWGTVFDSGIMKGDEAYRFTFEQPGEYNYLCALHPWMLGTVTVLPAGGSMQEIEVAFTTDRNTYILGDSVSLNGSISPVLGDAPAVVEVLDASQAQLQTETIAVAGDGTFSYDFDLSEELATAGSYTVRVTYSGTSAEQSYIVVEPAPGIDDQPPEPAAPTDVRVAAKLVRDFYIVRVRNAADSGSSVFGLAFEVPNHVIEAFKGPRDWSKPATLSDEVGSSTMDKPVGQGEKAYFKIKLGLGADDTRKADLIHWTAFDLGGKMLDEGDTKPISRGR